MISANVLFFWISIMFVFWLRLSGEKGSSRSEGCCPWPCYGTSGWSLIKTRTMNQWGGFCVAWQPESSLLQEV